MKDLWTSLRLAVLSVAACCAAYPLAVFAFARVAAPDRADGSLIADQHGTVVGSRLIAQSFERPEYFWPRPSAAGYNAAAAGGSNLSPAGAAFSARVERDLARLGLGAGGRAPVDLVTASGSGLDPHVSLAAAAVQIPRVAQARGLDEAEVRRQIDRSLESGSLRWFGGEPVVNVLKLNLALDRLRRPAEQASMESIK